MLVRQHLPMVEFFYSLMNLEQEHWNWLCGLFSNIPSTPFHKIRLAVGDPPEVGMVRSPSAFQHQQIFSPENNEDQNDLLPPRKAPPLMPPRHSQFASRVWDSNPGFVGSSWQLLRTDQCRLNVRDMTILLPTKHLTFSETRWRQMTKIRIICKVRVMFENGEIT